MRILIDADACPVVNLTIKIALQYKIEIILYCDKNHILEKENAKTIYVNPGNDAVDFVLLRDTKENDIVVTQDFGLASMILGKKAHCINQNGLIYNKFNIGREIYIRLKGLFIGETNSGNGIVTIGGKIKSTDITEIENVTVNQIPNHIYRSETTVDIIPKIIDFAGINESDIGTFITLENVFFEANLSGQSYVDPKEDFDTQRKIQTCLGLGYDELLVETSSFSRFSNETLPEKAGSINAIVSKDFGGNFIVLNINNTDDVVMNEERCSPLPIVDFTTILLDENFDDESGDIDVLNWINYREEGTISWRSYTDSYAQSKAARIGSKNSGNESTISWLITEAVNLDTTSQEFLSFETSNSFSNGSNLEVLISTDFNGDENSINDATWSVLPAKIVSDGEGFKNWIHSTYIELSKYSGAVYIAF